MCDEPYVLHNYQCGRGLMCVCVCEGLTSVCVCVCVQMLDMCMYVSVLKMFAYVCVCVCRCVYASICGLRFGFCVWGSSVEEIVHVT